MNAWILGAVVFIAVGVSACSGEGRGDARGEPVTAAECQAMVEKGAELQGIDLSAGSELLTASVQSCLRSGRVTKRDYQCVMAATSPSESRACNLSF